MAANRTYRGWSALETERLAARIAAGASYAAIAEDLGRPYDAVADKAARMGLGPMQRARGVSPTPAAPPAPPATPSASASMSADGGRISAFSDRVLTEEQLMTVCGVDRTRWEPKRLDLNKWEVGTKHPQTGAILVAPLFQVSLQLAPKLGPTTAEQVEAMVRGAMAVRPRPTAIARTLPASDVLQVLCVADPHVGKYAYARTTGHGDYDVRIATTELRACASYLLDSGAARRVGERVVAFLGDFFHYDTPAGLTTGGTAQDRDSRAEKMLEEGTAAACAIVAESATTARTHVVVVPGNHDRMLTIMLRLVLALRFEGHPNVTVSGAVSPRQYHAWGGNLLGFHHGDMKPEALADCMPIEAAREWGGSVYREVHTGHLHNEKERAKLIEARGTVTHAGVTVRTHRSLSQPDQWHSDAGYVGAPRGATAFYYHRAGACIGSDIADPRLIVAPLATAA